MVLLKFSQYFLVYQGKGVKMSFPQRKITEVNQQQSSGHYVFLTEYCLRKYSLREKYPYPELLWSVFFRIRTEYGEISLRIQSICGKLRTRKTWNTDNFDALSDLVLFVQFKKREKHPWKSVTFSKIRGFNLQLY